MSKMNYFITKKTQDEKAWIYINATSHPIDLVNAEPESLDERKVDGTIDIWETINGTWKDETVSDGCLTFLKRSFVISESELENVVNELAVLVSKDPDLKILLIVSLPVLLNYSEQIQQKAKELGIVVKPVSIVSATKRHIKPPVACMYYWSVI